MNMTFINFMERRVFWCITDRAINYFTAPYPRYRNLDTALLARYGAVSLARTRAIHWHSAVMALYGADTVS